MTALGPTASYKADCSLMYWVEVPAQIVKAVTGAPTPTLVGNHATLNTQKEASVLQSACHTGFCSVSPCIRTAVAQTRL